MSRVVRLLAAAAVFTACHAAEDPGRVAIRSRLKQEARLTPEELQRFFEQIGPVVAGKHVVVKEGALTRTLNDVQRTNVLGMLSNPSAVYDVGLKIEGKHTWRGVRTGATPVISELDAMQTLWIDVDAFTPMRYEFEYSSPGFGDYALDLTFTP